VKNNDAEQGTFHVFGPDMSTKSAGFPLIFKKLKDLVLILLRELQYAERILHAMLEICGKLRLLRDLIANFNFLTLWARSSEEWEFAMSLIIRGVVEDVWGGFVWKTCVEVGFLKERG